MDWEDGFVATRLDRKRVVDTALRLLNEDGLEGLTLRKIAKELNVQAPALYWHFASKQALLDEMATSMMRVMFEPVAEHMKSPRPGSSWQDWLADTMRTLRRSLLAYRDGAKVFSGTTLTDMSHAGPYENYLRAFIDLGFTLADAGNAHFTAYAFTIGFVIEEQTVEPVPGERDPRYDQDLRAARYGEEFPLVVASGTDMFANYDERFETGLRILVAGIEATLAPPSGRA
jgi:TetR/AcrR family tetracycline transcriptional repressor